MERIENLILRSLVHNEDYSRKVIPFIEPDYFHDSSERVLFEEIAQYMVKYNSRPSKEALGIEVEDRNSLTETEVQDIRNILSTFDEVTGTDEWMTDSTEKWCKKQAIYNALMESVGIANGDSKQKTEDAIPSILSSALAVSFDSNVAKTIPGIVKILRIFENDRMSHQFSLRILLDKFEWTNEDHVVFQT